MPVKTPKVPLPAGVFTDCGVGPRTIQAPMGGTILVCITDDGDAQPAAESDSALVITWAPGGASSLYVEAGERAWVKPFMGGDSHCTTHPEL